MYLRGRLTINLAGTVVDLRPPGNFFGGVANLLTRGSWEGREELETYKVLAFAQSANRALVAMGVQDVVRVAVAGETVYEDLKETHADLGTAMQALEERMAAGFEPDPAGEFDLVLKHDDGVLSYVIDLDFYRQHRPGVDPVSIAVTAVPSALRREPGESDAAYRQRVGPEFPTPEKLDSLRAGWERHLEGFLERIGDHFRTRLGIEDVRVQIHSVLPRRRSGPDVMQAADFGQPLYGHNPMTDLAYLWMWDSLWQQHGQRRADRYAGDTSADGGVWLPGTGDSGVGSCTWSAPAAGESGGGGWLSSIGDFFSSSGGGGDTGSTDAGGSNCGSGGSSCGSGCGGGGCGGGD